MTQQTTLCLLGFFYISTHSHLLGFCIHPNLSPFALQNIVGLIPLALILGEITEDLAVRFGPTVGGLLNATFGNVVELILSIVALTKSLFTVVAASLIGSILSNLLLVLGKLPVLALY